MFEATAKHIRCIECFQEIEYADAEAVVAWVLEHSCQRPRTVYVVLVDWGTMDGYPHHKAVDQVFAEKGDAVERARACRTRKPFPAVSAEVVEEIVR